MSVNTFRRKVGDVQARQFTADVSAVADISEWLPKDKYMFVGSPGLRITLHVDTTEGPSSAYVGDWIVREKSGDLYVYPDEVFRTFYEATESEASE